MKKMMIPLASRMAEQGVWLFRWRSYLPLLLAGLLIVRMIELADNHLLREIPEAWSCLCILVMASGLVLRAITVGSVPERTSGRNTKRQLADSLNTTGTYSIVRNPLYTANFLIGLSGFLYSGDAWLILIYALSFWCYYERIIATEEVFLSEKFESTYHEWAKHTPCLVPQFRLWKSFNRPMLVRRILAREYTSWWVATAFYAGIVTLHHSLRHEPVYHDFPAGFMFVGVSIVYVTVWILKHWTNLLVATATTSTPTHSNAASPTR